MQPKRQAGAQDAGFWRKTRDAHGYSRGLLVPEEPPVPQAAGEPRGRLPIRRPAGWRGGEPVAMPIFLQTMTQGLICFKPLT
jgi:hypothetical protein